MKKIGLVGLPNTGKSSFFKLLTGKDILVANYCFSTLNPETNIFKIYDEKLDRIASFFEKPKIIHAEMKISDIPGIIRNASKNSGKGSKFISQIRDCNAIIIFLRFFEDEKIIHFEGNYDPFRDFEIISIELILSDIEQIDKKIEKNNEIIKKSKLKNVNIIKEENKILEKIKYNLNSFQHISKMNLTKKEKEILKSFNFLTNKPSFIIANYNKNEKNHINKILNFKKQFNNFSVLEIDTIDEIKKVEKENIPFKNKIFFESIKKQLKLKTFFTAGNTEVRSWIIENSSNAKECANLIHSEIGNNLIKVKFVNENECKEKNDLYNKTKLEKKNYIIEDGEICNFIYSTNKINR